MKTLKLNSNGTPKGQWLFLVTDKLLEMGLTTDDVKGCVFIIDGQKFEFSHTFENGEVKICGLQMKW